MVSYSSGPGSGVFSPGSYGGFQQTEPLQSRAEQYKSPGDNSSPAGRTIAAGIGTASYDGQVVWWDGFKEGKNGKITASFIMMFADCIFTPTFDLVRLYADERLIVSNEAPVRTSNQKIRFYDGSQTTPDALLTRILGEEGATSWPRMCYAVFEDFNVADYGNRVPLIRAVLSGEASSAGSGTTAASTLTFGDIDPDDWVTVSSAWDRIRGVAYVSSRESGMVDTGWISTIDIQTNREVARVPVSIADGSDWQTPEALVALDGTEFIVANSLIGSGSEHELCLINVATGVIVAHLANVSSDATIPKAAILIENGAATRFLVFCITDHISTPEKSDLTVALVDVTSGTLSFVIHPFIDGKKVGGTGGTFVRSWALGPLVNGALSVYFTEYLGTFYYSDPQATVRKLVIGASSFSESVFYTETDSANHPLSVAYDFTDNGVVITREDGGIRKIAQDGTVEYTSAGVTGMVLLMSWGRIVDSLSLIGAMRPGYELAFADTDAHSLGSGGDWDIYLVNLADGSASLLFDGAGRQGSPVYYYDQFRGILIEEADDTVYADAIYQHRSGGDVTPNQVDLVDTFTQLATFDERFDESDLDFSGFPGNEMYGLKLENDTTIDNLEQSVAEPFDVKIVESDGKRKYIYPPRDGSFAISATLAADDFVERDTTIIEKGMGSGEQELAACTVAYFDRDAGYKKLEQTYQRPRGVFDVTRSLKKRTVNTILTLTASQALRRATEIVYRSVIGNESLGFGLVPGQAHREPGDILAIPFLGQTLVARITEGTLKADYTQDCFADQYLRFADATITGSGQDAAEEDEVSLDTRLLYLDLPLLSAAHDLAGAGLVQYALLYGGGEALVSGAVYRSLDGFEFAAVGSRSRIAPVAGIITAISGTPVDPFTKDETNTIEVQVQSGDIDRLVTITDAQFDAGTNLAAIGRNGRWVLLWFETVTPNSPSDGKVVLSDLMWGVRGSEVWIDDLAVGDSFVLLDPSEYLRFKNDLDLLGDTVLYKAANPAISLGSVPTQARVASGVAETPYACRNLVATLVGSDIELAFDYRSRIADGLNPTNHGEEELAFVVVIMDGTDEKRVIEVSASPAVWTAAEIAADFGTVPTPFTWRVYMMSAVVGRGYLAETETDLTAKTLAASAGSYALTGSTASLRHGWLASAAAGSYALTGSDATLTLSADLTLIAGDGAYALSGTAATVNQARFVSAGAGAYALTGTSATLSKGQRLAGDAGSYSVTGAAATPVHAQKIAASAGSYAVTGTAATLTKSTPAASYSFREGRTSTSTNPSFATVDIGAAPGAGETRHVVVPMYWDNTSGLLCTTTAVTIGGVSATRLTRAQGDDVSANAEIWIADVPTGTTATVAISNTGSTGSANRWTVASYALYNLASATPIATGSSATASSVGLSTTTGDFVFAATGRTSTLAYTTSGVTTEYDQSAGSVHRGQTGSITASGSSVTIQTSNTSSRMIAAASLL